MNILNAVRWPLGMALVAVSMGLQAQLPTTGRISLPGEVDDYVFRVDQERTVYFDARTRNSRLQWSLVGPYEVVTDFKSFTQSDTLNTSLYRIGPGEYRVRVEGQGDATGDYAFRLSMLGDGTTMTPGVELEGALNPGNATTFHQFTPVAGDRYRLSIPARVGLNVMSAWVVDPFGNPIGQAFPGSPIEFQTRNELPHEVLVVGGIQNEGQGGYTLLLAKLGQAPLYGEAPALVLGTEQILSTAGLFTNRYRFTLAGDTLLSFSPIAALPTDRWLLEGPERSVGEQSFYSSTRLNRARAGEYQLTVWRTAASAVPMRFLVQEVVGSASPLTVGALVSHTNRPAAPAVFFRMPMTAGQRVALLSEGVQGFLQGRPRWDVLKPDGTLLQVANQILANSTQDLGPWVAPVTGDYWLALTSTPAEDGTEGIRRFQWIETPAVDRVVQFGEELSGAIPAALGEVSLRFSVLGKKRIHLDVLESSPVTWRLEGTAGTLYNGRLDNETSAPFVLTGGEYRLVLSFNGRETPSYRLRLLDLEQAPTVALGATINGTHVPALGTAVYQLALTAGQRVLGRGLEATGFPGERPRWALLDPEGRVQWSQGFRDTGVETIQMTGKYVLLLMSSQSAVVGTPGHSFSILPVLQRDEPMVLDALVSGSIASSGEAVTYRFRVDEPMRVSMDHLVSADGSWNLFGPGGVIQGGQLYSDAAWEMTLLPGDHRLVISGTGVETPGYRFRLLNAASGSLIRVGETNEVTFDSARGSRYLRAELAAGQKLFLDRLGSSGFGSEPGVVLVGPEGNSLLNQRFGDIGAFTIPSGGVHTLLLRGDLGNADVAASVRFVLRAADEQVAALVVGSEIAGRISTPGEVRRLRWTQTGTKHYFVDSLMESTVGWSLRGAWGTVGAGRLYFESGIFEVPAGNAELTLDDAGESTGAYRLRLVALEDAPPVVLGNETVATLSPGTGTVVYGIPLVAGQRVQVRNLGATGFNATVHWNLYTPRQVSARSSSLGTLDYVALEAGIHVLAIAGSLQETAAGGTVRFQVDDLGTTPPTPYGGELIGFNQLVTGTTGAAGDEAVYRLTIAERTLATMDVTKTGGHRWSLEDRYKVKVTNALMRDTDTVNRVDTQLMVLEPGEYQLRVTGGVGAYEFRWLNAAEAPLVAAGTVQTLVHAPANTTRWFAFEGVAGEEWSYQGISVTGFARRPAVALWGPSGQSYSWDYSDNLWDRHELKETGRYLVYLAPYVEETGATATHQFQWIRAVDVPETIALNTVVQGVVSKPTMRPTYQFQLTEAKRLVFDALDAVSSLSVTLEGPLGRIQSFTFNSSDIDNSVNNAVFTLGPGVYRFQFDPSAATTPSFRFMIRELTPARALVFNQEMVGTNAPANRSEFYEFPVRAGESFVYQGLGGTGYAGTIYGDIYWPEIGGYELPHLGSYSQRFMAPRSGTAKMMISASVGDSGVEGIHRFRLWRVVDETNRLTLGTVVTGGFAMPSQQHVWTFRLTEPRWLVLDSLTNSSVLAQLVGPGGTFFNSNLRSIEDNASQQIIRAPIGDYALRLEGNGLEMPGYRFRLLDVTDAPLLTLGVANQAEMEVSRGSVVRRLRGTAGDSLYFDLLEYSGFTAGTSHRLISETGVVVLDLYANAEPSRFRLPATGDYYFVVNGSAFEPGAPPTYRYRFVVNPPGQPELILGTESLPDLVVESMSATPDPVVSGGVVTARWTTANRGNRPVVGPTTDRVVVRNEAGEVLVAGTVVDSVGNSAPGDQRARELGLTLPDGARATGPLTVEILVDATGVVREGNEVGTGESNNLGEVSLTGQLGLYPDLQVTGLRVSTVRPTPGQSVTVNWSTSNNGTAVARGPWNERVVVTNLGRRLVVVDAGVVGAADLAAGASVERSFTFELPTGANGYGTLAVQVQADAAGQVAEYNISSTAERNNDAETRFATALDLEVTEVRIPATIEPGVAFPVVHTVTNRTAIPATGNWVDSILWQAPDSTETVFANFPVSAGLLANASRTTTNWVTLPLDAGVDSLRVVVLVDRGDSLEELDEQNNRLESAASVVTPVLTLQLAANSLREDALDPAVRATVTRSGPTDQPLTVSVVGTDSTELTVPVSVVIPAGSARVEFDGVVVADGVTDGPQVVSVRVQAVGYRADEASLTVLDADLVRLSLRMDSAEVREGAVVRGVVSRNLSTGGALAVQLVVNDSAQLGLPGTVVIPAGGTEIAFEALAIEDTLVERTNVYTVTASAPGVPSVATSLAVLDNDVPSVTLVLAQRTVSEGAGANATSATLTRSPVTARAVRVALASANPGLVRLPESAVFAAGSDTATIPVAVIDNQTVEGGRPVVLGGAVLDSLNGTPVGEIVPDVLTVTDNDGPTLTLKVSAEAVGEGLNPAMTVTVSRNTPTTNPLVIALSSSDPSEATIPVTATILAGSDRVTVPVSSVSDGITDGNQTVILTASAAGFVDGVGSLVVSDADRPDLVIAGIGFAASGVAGESVPVTVRVENRGAVPAVGAVMQRLSISSDAFAGSDVLAGQVTYPGPLAPGSFFEQTLNVRLPDLPGTYYFVGETDVSQAVGELLESNNLKVSPGAIEVKAAYAATVATDVTVAVAGTPVTLKGQALRGDGSPARTAAVNVFVMVRGTTRTLPVVSGLDGRFEVLFQPLATEGGLYQISAAAPGVPVPAAQDEFRLLGMTTTPLPRLTVAEGEVVEGEVTVENRTDLPLSGLVAEVVRQHPSLNATVSLAGNALVGGGSVGLTLRVATVDTSAVESDVVIRVRSAEGAEVTFTTRVRQEIRVPRLVSVPGSLNVAMVRGRQTPVTVTLRNEGGLETGPLKVQLPQTPWLSLSSPSVMDSVAPGSNVVVTLLLTPPADLSLGEYVRGFSIGNERVGLTVPATFRAISDGVGDLAVTAEDEYTYFAEGSPKLANALVVLNDALSGTPVRTNRTGLDGRVVFTNLTEAYYFVTATADDHGPFRQTALVVAGGVTNVTAFLPREAVKYTFIVEPTTVEDRYTLRVESTFETQVPLPVVTIEPAVIDIAQYPGQEFQLEVTVKNHGLIAANSVRLNVPSGRGFTVTPLVTDLGPLPAGASLKVPVVIRRVPPGARASASGMRGRAGKQDDDTFDDNVCSAKAELLWDFMCGGNTQQRMLPWTIYDSLGCDESELFTRVFRYVEEPLLLQSWVPPEIIAFLQSLPPTPFDPPIPVFRRLCRPAPLVGPLPNNPSASASTGGRGGAAPAAGEEAEPDVCARVKLGLDQSVVLTRDAFKATLEVENDTDSKLEDVLVNLVVQRPNGTNVTEQFGIRVPELDAFSAVDGTGTLGTRSVGRARWTLIPTLDVAPTNGPTVLLVSGTLSYRQDGKAITVPLASAPITVYPQPELRVRYFHERDVFADDPFTPEIEPSVPYSLGLQVLNVGYGDARGLRIAGGRPQIIGNEKGLQIEFKTLGTQIESQSLSPVLDIDLGAIPAGTNRNARWLFSSTLQGSFTNFAASFEHTDALGGRRLSLIRDVEIHELNHIVNAGKPDNDGRADYLVNDEPDAAMLPDAIYRSNGTREPVQAITEVELTPTGLPGEYQVAIQSVTGWAYVRIGLPEDLGTLASVTRPDGTLLPVENHWQTDRFMRGGDLRPIRTNLVHWFEGSPSGTYRLSFAEPNPLVADGNVPTSRVLPLLANSPLEFTVEWSGDDGVGSGIAHFDIYSSVDGGAWTRWIEKTPETSARFRAETGKSYAFYSVATDRAGNREAPPAVGDASTAATLTNRAPAFGGTLAVQVDEGARLEGFVVATDPDAGQRVRFEVLGGAPAGWIFDGDTGRYYWSPTEADGPGVWEVRVRATDNGNPVRSVDSVLRVGVREVNQAPTLASPGDFLILERARLGVALTGSDADQPRQTVRYSLVEGPEGAGVDAVTGDFTWRPRADQGGRSYAVRVRVTDNGTPALSGDVVFAVAVRDTTADLLLVAGRTAVANGDAGELPFSINAAPELADLSFQLELPADRVQVPAIVSLAPEVKSATLVPVGPDRSEFRVQLRQGGSLLATRSLLRLGFQTVTSARSHFVPVVPENLTGHTESGALPGTIASQSGHIVLVGEDPVLLMQWSTEAGGGAELLVHGLPGVEYLLETRDRADAGAWREVGPGEIPPDGLIDVWREPLVGSEGYFRAVTRAPR